MTRTIARSAGALALAAVAVVLVAAPAQAAAYRYWTYWQAPTGATDWAFATQGPATSMPDDGAVEGWSFGVTTSSGSPEDAPANAPDFASLCADTPAQPGSKRVALVVDTGAAALAPAGDAPPAPVTACVVADEQASGYEILRSVVEVRTEDGLVCGVAGYPARECAPVLDDAEAEALLAAAAQQPVGSASQTATSVDSGGMAVEPAPDDAGTPYATIAVAVLLLGGGAIAAAASRRRGRSGNAR